MDTRKQPARSAGRIVAAAALVALSAAVAAPAAGGTLCLPRQAMAENLRAGHDERPVAIGLDNSGVIVEVFAAPAGNWTILMTHPSGMACLMAAGQGWETLPEDDEGDAL